MVAKGILLDENHDLLVKKNRLAVGNSVLQEVAIILKMAQGELKFNPMIGANLTTMIRSGFKKDKIQREVEIHLDLDNKNYDDVKQIILLNNV